MQWKKNIESKIEKQLLEIESLKSMFFCENEFKVINEESLKSRELFLKKELCQDLLNSIDIELNVVINDIPINIAVEIPTDYPDSRFSALIRCRNLNRQQHINVNADSAKYLSELDIDSLSVISIIDWLREQFHKYVEYSDVTSNKVVHSIANDYSRYWIYSHHLYSKAKKNNIKNWAKEMNINGFFLSGKPGIICVEGLTDNIQMFWWNIRHLNWKRLILKEQEVIKLNTPSATGELINWKKFFDFKEVTFVNSPENPDFSLFIKWLKDLHADYIIPILFGIDGK